MPAPRFASYSEGELREVAPGRWRTARRGGPVGAHPLYIRAATDNIYRPPFTFTGTFRAHSRLDEVWIASEQRAPTWDWAVNLQVHQSNNRNVYVGVGGARTKYLATNVEYDGYKPADHWQSRYRSPNRTMVDGRDHTFKIEVPRWGAYYVWLDGELVADGHEKVTPFSGPTGVGLRLDFFDVELWDLDVTETGAQPMSILPRNAWSKFTPLPVTGPAFPTATVDTIPIHYTAAPSTPHGGDDVARYLASIHNDYVRNRGYSIGYNFAVDRTGQAWTLRGLDFKCAANKGWNDRTAAILCLVNGADMANPPMVSAIRKCVAAVEAHVGRQCKIVAHRDIGATACPGVGLTAQVRSGTLRPQPTPPPSPEEPVSLIGYFTGKPAQLVVLNALGWRNILPEEVGELEFVGLARKGPDGRPVAFPATWEVKYPRVGR
jgi:hypothetical protein